MSKELIKQLAKEHGEFVSERFDIARDWPNDFAFTLDELEAFAKAYQAAAPIDNVAELKRISTLICISGENSANDDDSLYCEISKDYISELRNALNALIPNRTEG
jgi:hypothetical protein